MVPSSAVWTTWTTPELDDGRAGPYDGPLQVGRSRIAVAAGVQHEEIANASTVEPRWAPDAHPVRALARLRSAEGPLMRGDRVACRVVLAVALRDGPLHDGTDALADAPGGFPLRRPDRKQCGHDVGGGDPVDALAAEVGEGVVALARKRHWAADYAAVLPVLGLYPRWRWDRAL